MRKQTKEIDSHSSWCKTQTNRPRLTKCDILQPAAMLALNVHACIKPQRHLGGRVCRQRKQMWVHEHSVQAPHKSFHSVTSTTKATPHNFTQTAAGYIKKMDKAGQSHRNSVAKQECESWPCESQEQLHKAFPLRCCSRQHSEAGLPTACGCLLNFQPNLPWFLQSVVSSHNEAGM